MSEAINVNGIAVRAGVSRNGIFYPAEELHKFAKTLKGVSIIKNHDAIVENTIGLVTSAKSIDSGKEVSFEGWIKDEAINERIKDGRVKHVSIGALVEKLVLEDEDNDYLTAKGITCVELSTVVVPGVPGASINQKTESADGKKKKVLKINENISDFIELELEENKKDEKMFSVKTSPDPKDGHTHMAKCDMMTGMGKTSKGGTPEYGMHKHEVEDFKVVPFKDGDYTSKHPGKLKEESIDSNLLQDANNIKQENKIEEQTKQEASKKMAEEQTNELQATIVEKETKLQEQSEKIATMKAQLEQFKKEKKEALVAEYKRLATEKSVEVSEVSNVSEETLKFLIEQVRAIKVAEKVVIETPKAKPKGEVSITPTNEIKEDFGNLLIEKSEFGRGVAIFKESYEPSKFKRLSVA